MLNPELAKIYQEKVQIGLQPVVDFFESRNIPAYVIGESGRQYNLTMPAAIVWDDVEIEDQVDDIVMNAYFKIVNTLSPIDEEAISGIACNGYKKDWEQFDKEAVRLWVN